MPEQPGTEDAPSDEEELDPRLQDPLVLAWFGENLPELRRSAYGHGILYRTLAFGFALGLAAHVGGYALRSSSPSEPLALIADLLYALGYALWTGVVVVLFTQVIPEVKRRQVKRAVDAYEATLREEDRARNAKDQERPAPDSDG